MNYKFEQVGNGIFFNNDCLEVMSKLIENNIKVDAVITDIPYGTTACKWDSIIPFDSMWDKLNKLIKEKGAIVLFGNEPFSSELRCSNKKAYKYDWKWVKPNGTTPNLAKIQPMRRYEDIMVFNSKTYYPQMEVGKPYNWNSKRSKGEASNISFKEDKQIINEGLRYPTNVLFFPQDRGLHPTQKPVVLMEYLIRTYTKENELVLDFTMGSGTTCVACQNLNRKFIGIELNKTYFDIAKNRIKKTLNLKI